MTVCIAAYGNVGPNGPPVVATASDRMITIDDIEYEPDQTKAIQMAAQTVVLLAGDMETHATVAPEVMRSLRENPPPGLPIKTIAERYAWGFSCYRRYLAEQEILMPLGLTLDDFLKRQKDMAPDFVRDVADRLLNSQVNSEAIVAGVDHTGAHIYKIVDPGVCISFDTPCFAAIGIGRPHAESYLMTTGFHKNMSHPEVVYAVFSAKMKAEIAAGVGSKTDLFIVRGDLIAPPAPGGTYKVTDQEIARFREIFTNQQQKYSESYAHALDDVRGLIVTATTVLDSGPPPPAPSGSADEASDEPEEQAPTS